MMMKETDHFNSLSANILHYIFFQFKVLCKSHSLDIQKAKISAFSCGQNFNFIQQFLDKAKHQKILMKKLSKNGVIRDAFKECLLDAHILNPV